MGRYAVAVRFTIHSGRMKEFLPLVTDQAEQSRLEAGCIEFQVWADPSRPNEVFLWEVYTSPEAFLAHIDTLHFKRFDARIRDLVGKKVIETLSHELAADRGGQPVEAGREAHR